MNTIINKKQPMTGLNKTEQFLHENITWKRLLDFFMQENSYLKTRLSKVVDRENDNLLIDKAEYFQNEFILKDEYIQDIEDDIEEQKINLDIAFKKKEQPDNRTSKMQEKLRNEMSYLEKEFSILKNQFNEYLLSIV